MSTTVGTTAGSTALGTTARTRLASARTPLLLGGFAVLVSLLLAALTGQERAGLLDPRATDPRGSRAVARVLESRGVSVELVRTVGEAVTRVRGGSATLLLASDALIPDEALSRLAGAATDVVLVAPAAASTTAFLPGLAPSGEPVRAEQDPRPPACVDPDARAAGPADLAGQGYAVAVGAQMHGEVVACYPREGNASLVVAVRPDGSRVVVLGDPAPLTNTLAGEHGNAALDLRLLGRHPRLVWLLPDGSDQPDAGQRSLTSLLPAGVRWAALQLVVAVAVLAMVRARRLGRVVPEPLPVVVRASETTEGRARLYRRARARDRAGDALRSATVARLLPRLGLPSHADATAVVPAVAVRAGRRGEEVAALLYGPAPADDAALVSLATELDTLEREVTAP